MTDTSHHDERIARMAFAAIYPLYLQKVEKKGKTQAELNQVITWLTDFDDQRLQELIDDEVDFEEFFK